MNKLELPRKPAGSWRLRRAPITSATLHYNGPSLPFVPNPARELEFIRTVDVRTHQTRLGADGLQYHFVVLSDGAVYQTRDLDRVAWHCGNQTGNEQSLAVHLPLGVRGNAHQEPTSAQWRATTNLFRDLAAQHGFPAEAVYGHNEWPRNSGAARPSPEYRLLPRQSACPGRALHKLLAEYRARPAGAVTTWVALWRSPIRQAPRVTFEKGDDVPIAGWLEAGEEFEVDLVKNDGDAQVWAGNGYWLHLADGRGFTWMPNARQV